MILVEKGSANTYMQNSHSGKESLLKIVELFDQAEAKVKEVEQLSNQLSIPSINQLRYVGYHLVRSICADDTTAEFSIQIEKAERHCKRAIYDAVEIGIIYLFEKIKNFQDDYSKHSEVVTVLNNYIELCQKTEDAKEFITKIRDGHNESRDQYYAECQPVYSTLKEITQTLELARPTINLLIEKNQQSDKTSTRRFIVFVLLSLAAILIALYRLM